MTTPVNTKAFKHKSEPLPLDLRIKSAMALRGWSQARLASEIGRARNTVNRAIHHGENAITLQLILTTLGVRR